MIVINPTKLSKFNKALKRKKDLRYKKYLPRSFYSNLMISWIESRNLFRQFFFTTKDQEVAFFNSRVFSGDRSDLSLSLRKALTSKWLNYQFFSVGQTTTLKEIVERGQYKFLLVRFDISYLKGQSYYRRFLQLLAIIEYYTKTYKKVRVILQCYDINQSTGSIAFKKYSARYKSFYYATMVINFSNALTFLQKLLGFSIKHSSEQLKK